MKQPSRLRPLCLVILLALAAGSAPLAAKIRIRMGTIAPKDSIWHNALKQIDADWTKISGGEINITIYPAGQLGDEPEMVRKVRQGTLQAVALSQVGLSHIDSGVSALHVPMLLDSNEELDYVRDKLAPEARAAARPGKASWCSVGATAAGCASSRPNRRARPPISAR